MYYLVSLETKILPKPFFSSPPRRDRRFGFSSQVCTPPLVSYEKVGRGTAFSVAVAR